MNLLYDPVREKPPTDSEFPLPVSVRLRQSKYYLPSDDLVKAVNVALWLGQPLLLTGEPGTGKTELAYDVARKLSLDEPIRFDVKSTTEARDLFYSYDGLREFRDSRPGGTPLSSKDYFSLQALGLAILLACSPEKRKSLPLTAYPARLQKTAHSAEPRRSLVLIDEIDKAPRDVPNDILNEIENDRFWSPEIREGFDATPQSRPVVILTSNSERGLPEAFLRRCAYFHIEFPDAQKLAEILGGHGLGRGMDKHARLVRSVSQFVDALRRTSEPLKKKPGLVETLVWLAALVHVGMSADDNVLGHEAKLHFEQTLPALIKNLEDRETALRIRTDLAAV